MSQVAIRNNDEPRTSIQSVAFSQGKTGGQIAPQSLGDILRFAEVMARADVAIPKYLRDNPGACLAVCMQAFNWEMNPFAVAQKSYKVNDIIAYEAQLIAAVINTRAGLRQRPSIAYEGEGKERRCIVTFAAIDGSEHVYRSPAFEAITPKNSPLWKSDPDQQLAYYSVRAGARRHFPEVILGVYDRDELEGVKDVTPTDRRSSFAARMAARTLDGDAPQEGFDRAGISNAVDGSRAAETVGDALNASAPAYVALKQKDAPATTGEVQDGDPIGGRPEEAAPPAFDPSTTNKLTRYAADMLNRAAGENEDACVVSIKAGSGVWASDLKDLSKEARDFAGQVFRNALAVARGEADADTTVGFIAERLGVQPSALQGSF